MNASSRNTTNSSIVPDTWRQQPLGFETDALADRHSVCLVVEARRQRARVVR